MESIRVFLLACLACFSPLAAAGTAVNLYSSEQLVAQQFGEPSLTLVRQGLSDVLVKVAGNRDILSEPVILDGTKNAKSLLQQFGYQAAKRAVEPNGDAQEGYLLTLDFDPAAVNRLLDKAGERPMGDVRPTLLVWLAAQEQGQQDYLSPDGYIYAKVKQVAAQRGLPLQVPLLDLQDQSAMPVSDLWGLFESSLAGASERYRPDAVLAGRLIQTPSGSWHYEWLLMNGDKQERFSGKGAVNAEITRVIEKATDTLFAALQESDFSYRMDGLELNISNVNNVADYIEVTDYLRSLPTVVAVHTVGMQSNALTLNIELDGNLEQFEHTLGLQPRLAATGNSGADMMGVTLNYRWQK